MKTAGGSPAVFLFLPWGATVANEQWEVTTIVVVIYIYLYTTTTLLVTLKWAMDSSSAATSCRPVPAGVGGENGLAAACGHTGSLRRGDMPDGGDQQAESDPE